MQPFMQKILHKFPKLIGRNFYISRVGADGAVAMTLILGYVNITGVGFNIENFAGAEVTADITGADVYVNIRSIAVFKFYITGAG